MRKRIYGIDLGTTNSAICLEGELITGLVPSIANLSSNTAGEELRRDFTAERSFKVNISMGQEGVISRKASSLVMKKMVDICASKGHVVEEVVISVPAYFTSNQRTATREAATAIGLKVHAVANEPTVAAMEYSRDESALSVVFDLGGGTFDISIIDSRTDTYDVLATDGIVVGGDNFDKEIMRNIVKSCGVKLHHLTEELSSRLQSTCSDAKVSVQVTGETVVVDLSFLGSYVEAKLYDFTVDNYKEMMRKTFDKCLVTTKRLVEKNVAEYEEYKLLFVGGSTRCPYLKEWIEKELNHESVEQVYNPDTIVALGAAHYAKLIEIGEIEFKVSDVTKAIGITKIDGTVERVILAGSKLPAEDTIMLSNPEDCLGLNLAVVQGDSLMAESCSFIGLLKYEFGEMKEAYSANVEVTMKVSMDGICEVTASELFKEPQTIKLII